MTHRLAGSWLRADKVFAMNARRAARWAKASRLAFHVGTMLLLPLGGEERVTEPDSEGGESAACPTPRHMHGASCSAKAIVSWATVVGTTRSSATLSKTLGASWTCR